jgi:hypothetical protein
MEARWDSVPLGEVLRPALDPHKVDASRSYPNLGIYSFGRGVFQKPPIEGTNTSASTLYQVRAGQFIYSRLFAFEGAYGLVPRECDGFYVSNEFPTFDCDSQRLDAGFVSWLFKRPTLWRDIAARSTGMGDRRQRIHPEQVLAEIVPLPPLAEQRRIVARIDAFAAKITEARRLREETAKVVTALSASILDSMLPQDAVQRPLGDLVKQGTSISYGVLVPGPEVSDGVPFVRIQDLSIKHPNDQPNKRIAAEVAASYARTRLRGGEVLVGVVGSIGKIGIAPPSWAGANIARAVCRIVPGEGVDARFLAETLSDRRWRTRRSVCPHLLINAASSPSWTRYRPRSMP